MVAHYIIIQLDVHLFVYMVTVCGCKQLAYCIVVSILLKHFFVFQELDLHTIGVDQDVWYYSVSHDEPYKAENEERMITFYTWDFAGQVCKQSVIYTPSLNHCVTHQYRKSIMPLISAIYLEKLYTFFAGVPQMALMGLWN